MSIKLQDLLQEIFFTFEQTTSKTLVLTLYRGDEADPVIQVTTPTTTANNLDALISTFKTAAVEIYNYSFKVEKSR